MNPHKHALSSQVKYGGKWEDYIEIHNFLDMTKAAHPDLRHRAILHNSMGPFIAERVFGVTITNSSGKLCSVRQICEDHIMEDFGGFIPTVSSYLQNMTLQPWMAGNRRYKRKTARVINFKDTSEIDKKETDEE